MKKQGSFEFELPPPPTPPNEDQLRGYIHPLARGAVSESMVPGNLPIVNRTRPVLRPAPSSTKIDAQLLSRISRGREAGLRAVRFDEVGDLSNAEELYMEALSVLIPASRDLDRGPNSNRSARLREKTKVQREASGMLNRCEWLRSQIEVDDSRGPGVPQELPNTLIGAPSIRNSNTCIDKHNSNVGGNSDSRRPAPNRLSSRTNIPAEPKYVFYSRTNNVQNGSAGADVDVPLHLPETARPSLVPRRQPHMNNDTPQLQSHSSRRENSSQVPTRQASVSNSTKMRPRNANLTGPRNIDFYFQDNIKDRTLPMGMSERPTVGLKVPDNELLFEVQDVGSHTAGRDGNRGPGREVGVELCVVCGDAANFRAPCGHGFCTKCGNQSVRVFGSCPVFSCNTVLSFETFQKVS